MVEFPIIATDVESVLAMQAHLLRDDNNDQVLRDVIVTQIVEARRSAAACAPHGSEAPVRNNSSRFSGTRIRLSHSSFNERKNLSITAVARMLLAAA